MKFTWTNKWSRLARFAALGTLAAVPLALMFASGHAQVSVDLFDLLPKEERDPVLAAATAQSRDAFFDQLDIVIRAPKTARKELAEGARQVSATLSEAPVALNTAGSRQAALHSAYRKNPFQWLAAEDRAALLDDPAGAFRNGVARSLARPGSFDTADPAGYLDGFLSALPAPGAGWTLIEGFPARVSGERVSVFLNGRLTAEPLLAETQAEISAAMERARANLDIACGECDLHWSGAVRFGQETRLAAESDVARLSTAAVLGIVLLFAFAFRSLRPLGAALTILAAGILAGLSMAFAVFGKLHVLTLVFGTTLLGLAVDYILHFSVHRWAHPEHDAGTALRAVRPGLALGLLTSLAAFMFLLLANFPALSQLAIFSGSGLLAAWMLVCFWLPGALQPAGARNPLARIVAAPPGLGTPLRFTLLAVISLAAIAGLPRLDIVDDVRGLQAIPEDLSRDERVVRETTRGLPGRGSSEFLVIEGRDLDEALAHEAALFGNGVQGFGLSRFVQDRARRGENIDAWAPLFDGEPSAAEQVLAEFGIGTGTAEALRAAWEQSDAIASEALLREPGLAPLGALRAVTPEGVALIAWPENANLAALPEGVREVRPLENVENTFAAIRLRAASAVGGAYLLMLLVLAWRYGPVGALRVLAPALLGAGCALGLLGLAGLPLNVFSLVALILVLGIGADYALFLREGHAFPDTARLATGLAAATSLLSFGLLMFSNLPALRAFGFATATGIFTAYLAAPLVLPRRDTAAKQIPMEAVHDRPA